MKTAMKWLVCGVATLTATTSGTNLPLFEEDDANLELVQHPRVQASANVVVIDDQSVPNDFFGPLYIGTNMVPLKVSYDTLSDWTVISSQQFNVMSSDSQSPWVSASGDPVQQSVSFGSYHVTGSIYNETMCLIYDSDTTHKNKARLCAEQMPFVYASLDSDSNSYQGMLGLARGTSRQINYVKLLHMQGIIKKPIVSLNFENPMSDTEVSQIGFGEVLYSEIMHGEDGIYTYSNLGRTQWGLRIDDFLYNGLDMTNGQKPKIALIDSASVGIQLPEFVWHNIYVSMSHQALSSGKKYQFRKEKTEKGHWEIRIPNMQCKDVVADLEPIQFKLEATSISIYPKGYTYQIDPNQDYCQIGLNPILKESHEYRLGNIFLRHFYTALDYDKDTIMIGVNKGSEIHATATVEGQSFNPYKEKPKQDKSVAIGVIILIYLLMCTTIFIYFFIEKRKLDRMSALRHPELYQQEAPQISEIKTETASQEKSKGKDAKYAIQDEDDSLNESLTNSERLNSTSND